MQHSLESPSVPEQASAIENAEARWESGGPPRVIALALLCGCLAGAAHGQGLPFTESFDNQTFRDPTRTRASSWGEGASPGQLKLSTAEALASTFSEATVPVDLPGEFITRALALGDLDGDGDLDLAEGASGMSGVYHWDSTVGQFAARVPFEPTSANTRGIAVGDVDADGDLDVVTGNLDSPPRLFLNAGDGVTFTGFNVSPAGRRTDHVGLVDVNLDGFLDVVTANHTGFRNAIYFNTGDPLQPFGPNGVPAVDISTAGDNTQQLVWGDVDNDGDIDFVALNENQVNKLHGNRGDGTFSNTSIGDEAEDSQAGALGDLNGDGFLDLVVANGAPPGATKVYLNTVAPPDSPGRFVVPGVPLPDSPSFAHSVRLADADNDGDLDIFLSTAGPAPASQTNRLYLNDGAGTFSTYVLLGASIDITNSGAVGDVDNDGDLDYVAGNENRDPANVAIPAVNRLFLNGGTPTGTQAPQLRGVASSLRVDAESAPIASVRLRVNGAIGAHNSADFWVSANGGLGWVHAMPNRPVAIPPAKQGTDLRWRVEISSSSPNPALGAGAFALDDVVLELNTSAPTRAAPIGDQSGTQNTPFGPLDAAFTDADGDRVFHSLAGLPDGTGITIDPLTGVIGGVPTNADAMASPIAVTLIATDGGLRTEQPFTLTVANVNDAPVFTSTPVTTATGGTPYAYTVTVADPDVGDVVAITAAALPAWLTLTDHGNGTATLSGTPSDADAGAHAVSLVATDAGGATAPQDFTVSVAAAGANAPPAFTSTAPTTATVGTEYVYAIVAADPNGEPVTISAPILPAWLVLTDHGDGTAELRGTPAAADVGDHPVALAAADAQGATAPQEFVITVAAAGGSAPQNPEQPPPSGGAASGGGGGGGGGGAAGLLELLGVVLLAALRPRRPARAGRLARARCM
ncbi:MAG TPA: FG-GAP-like repeat-containing protein [Gammaproteobacteria bacterium]